MFIVELFKRNKIFFRRTFATQEEAKDFINLEAHDHTHSECEYQIIDEEKENEIDSGTIECPDSINEMTDDLLFPDGDESKAGSESEE